MADTLEVKIDTTAAKASLDSLKEAVSKLSTSLTNIDKKNDAFDRLVSALSNLNTSGISGLASSFGQLSQTASQAATAAQQVAGAARQASSSSQAAAGAATQWAAGLRQSAQAAAQNISGLGAFNAGLTGVAAALARTGGGLSAATGQFGQFGVAIQNSVSNFNMLSGIGFPPGVAAGVAAATAAIVAMAAALPALLGAIIDTNNQIIAFKNTMDAIRGSGAGETAFRQLAQTANETGTSIGTLSKNFAGFDAAAKSLGVTTGESQKMFKELAGAMRVMGVDGIKAERVMNAFQQMAAKGKVQMEELKQQMGEALPTAIQAMANALNVTIDQMTKMLEQGQVSASILPRFTQELLKLSGGMEAVTRATLTVSGQMTLLNNNFTLLAESFGKGLNLGFMSQLAEGLSRVNAALDNTGFHLLARAIGDVAGLLANVFLSAVGAALQVLSVFAAGVAGAIAVFTGFARGIMEIINAVAGLAAVKAFMEGFNTLFAFIAEGMDNVAIVAQSTFNAIKAWFSEFYSGSPVLQAFGSALSTLVGVLSSVSQLFGASLGTLAAFATVVGAGYVALNLLTAAYGMLAAMIGPIIARLVAQAAATLGVAAASTTAATAVRVLAAAMMMLAANPIVLALTAAAAAAVILYNAFPQVSEAVDNAVGSFTSFVSSMFETKTAAADLNTVLTNTVPSLSQIEATMSKLYSTGASQAEMINRVRAGYSDFEASASGAEAKMRSLDAAIRSNNNSMASLEEASNRSKNAGKEFAISIDSQIARINRQKQGMSELGMQTDLYDTQLRKLNDAKKMSALADQDADLRLQRERQSIQAANEAMEQRKAKMQELAQAQKHFGAALTESEIAMAREIEALNVGKDVAAQVAQSYTVMKAGIGGFVDAIEQSSQAHIRERDAVNQKLALFRQEQAALAALNEGKGPLTEAEKKYASTINGTVSALERSVLEKNKVIGAERALVLQQERGLSAVDAQKAAFNELSRDMQEQFGSFDDYRQKLAEAAASEAKAVEDKKKLADATDKTKTASEQAAAEMEKIGTRMQAIANGGPPAKAGVDSLAGALDSAAGKVAPATESFQKLSGALSNIATQAGELVTHVQNLAVPMTTLGASFRTLAESTAIVKFDAIVAAFGALAPLVPVVATNFNSFASANTLLSQSMPIVNEQMTKLSELLPLITPQTTLLGEASTQIGTGFAQWGASLPLITEGLTAMQETLPPFVTSMTTLATALEKIKGSTDALKLMASAIEEVLPKLDEMKTAITGVKSAVDLANKSFGEDFVKAVEEAGPKASAAVSAMADKIASDMARVVAAIQQAIDKLKELAAAQSSTSGGGGGDTTAPAQRYGGMAGVSSQVQSVSPGAFANAPQFASGTDNTNKFMRKLPGGGIPSILHPNEAVVPLPKGGSIPVQFTTPLADQTNMLSSALDALASDLKPLTTNAPPPTLYATDKIEAAVKAAANAASTSRGRANDSGGGEPPMNINFNITTPDADSFKRSETQIKADAYRVMREAYNRNR